MRPFRTDRARMHGRRFGFSLLEIGLTLALVGLALAAMVQYASDSARQVADSAAADRLIEVSKAAQSYLTAQSASLITSVPVGGTTFLSVGRPNAGAAIPAGSLQAMGYLPAAYIDQNSYGQYHYVVIRQTTAGNLDLLVETINGRTIPDLDLGRITAKVGAIGGMVQATPPPTVPAGTIQGAGGGFSEPAGAWISGGVVPSSGHVMAVSYANQNTVLADYLYRNNIGIHEANTMHASIDMTHNGLTATGSINNVDTTSGANAPISIGSNLQGTGGAPVGFQNGLQACLGDATGCGVQVSNDGGFYDENDGWIRYMGASSGRGLYIDGTGNNLTVGGVTNAIGKVQAQAGVALYNNSDINWPDVNGAYLTADGDAAFLHIYNGGLRADGDIDTAGNLFANKDISATQSIYAGQDIGANGNVTGTNVAATQNLSANNAFINNQLYAGGNVISGTAMYAPIYYDLNNAAYYVQPSGYSNLNTVFANYLNGNYANINNDINAGGNIAASGGLYGNQYVISNNDVVAGGQVSATGNINGNANLNIANAIFATQGQFSNGVESVAGFYGGPGQFVANPSDPALSAFKASGNVGITGNVAVNGILCTPRGCY